MPENEVLRLVQGDSDNSFAASGYWFSSMENRVWQAAVTQSMGDSTRNVKAIFNADVRAARLFMMPPFLSVVDWAP